MLEVKSLSKQFVTSQGVIPVIRGIDLEIPKGRFYTLLGPSGCGKTTTLRCVAGFERPDQGEIRIKNQWVFSNNPKVFVPPYRRGIGMVFQSYALWPHLNVFGNVAYPLQARNVSKKVIAEKVNEVLNLVGLDSTFTFRPVTQLSGGQQFNSIFIKR